MNYNILSSSNMDDLYKLAINRIIYDGEYVTARGLNFKECRFQHLILSNPRARIINNSERKFSKRFAIAEFIWMMTGKCDLSQISFYNKRMAEFSDNGIDLHGAYGPRLRHWSLQHGDVDQLTNCLQRLQNDIYTRQASIAILDPAIDFTVKTKDVPCNNYIQFLYRNNKLDMMVYVRSNDLLLGFPYDIFEWTLLQEIYASSLHVDLGEYHHIVGSLHIYKQNMDKMNSILQCPTENSGMDKMPEDTDLGIFDILEKFEKEYRNNPDRNLVSYPTNTYWNRLANWLVK
jgi:thymidylate synthase